MNEVVNNVRFSIDKRVFGVPLVLFLQRTGQTLPTAIQTAFKWLKLNALDQVRIRKKPSRKKHNSTIKCILITNQLTTNVSVSGWIIP